MDKRKRKEKKKCKLNLGEINRLSGEGQINLFLQVSFVSGESAQVMEKGVIT